MRVPKNKPRRSRNEAPARPRASAELKRAEEALRHTKARFELMAGSILDVIWMADINLRYTYISPSILSLTGWTVEEMKLKGLADIVAPSSLEAANRVLEEGLAMIGREGSAPVVPPMEVELLRKDGSTVWTEIRATAFRDPEDGSMGIIGVTRDITEHRRTEEDLKLRNILLSTEQDVSPDGILVVDEDSRILSYNRRFVDMWGIPDEVVAEKADEKALAFVTGKVAEPEKFLDKVNYLYENRREESRDEIALADGRVFDRYSAPMYGAGEHYYGRVWFFRDITARRQAEADVRRANDQLSAMVKKLEEHVLKDRLLGEMQEFLLGCSRTEEIGPVIARAMDKLFPDAAGALFLLSPSRTDLEASARWGGFPDGPEDNIFAPDACWGLRRGGNYVVEDVSSGIACPHLKHFPEGAYACLPLMAKGDVLGLLHFRSREGGTREGDARMLAVLRDAATTLSEMLSLSLSNILLRETLTVQSIRDPLTGMFNRRYMEESFQREIRRALRKNDKIGVIMIDIDHFKNFNDLNGHPAGDAVLSGLGEFFKGQMRGGDIVSRYGGEEFTLILPECSLEDAGKRAVHLVEEARKLRIQYHNRSLGAITLSMGVSAFPQHGETAEDLLKAADIALYRAKQEGRDRVVLAQ